MKTTAAIPSPRYHGAGPGSLRLTYLIKRLEVAGAPALVTPQAMNQLVALLERDQLVERHAEPDNRRILRTTLTDRGRRVLESCHAAVDELEVIMLAALTTEQTRDFRRNLELSLTALTQFDG